MSQQTLFDDRSVTPRPAELVECDHCGFNRFVDTTLGHKPHNGRSVRRDCARCHLTMGFPTWYGLALTLEQRPRRRALSTLCGGR